MIRTIEIKVQASAQGDNEVCHLQLFAIFTRAITDTQFQPSMFLSSTVKTGLG